MGTLPLKKEGYSRIILYMCVCVCVCVCVRVRARVFSVSLSVFTRNFDTPLLCSLLTIDGTALIVK